MAIDAQLSSLRSAGLYRFEKDLSQISSPTVLANTRLIIGCSRIGPFNTPVYIRSTKEFVDIFGDIDRVLEKRGSFFHRSCLAALQTAPIYAMNILGLDEEDYVQYLKLAPSITSAGQQTDGLKNINRTGRYLNMYNTDHFYFADPDIFAYEAGYSTEFNDTDFEMLDTRDDRYNFMTYMNGYQRGNTNDLLNFVNIGNKPMTIMVCKSNRYNVSNFEVTASEWFGKANVPSYIDENSFISDFFVDVYIIQGNYGGDFKNNPEEPYKRFESDVKFAKYFDKVKGIKRKKNEEDTTDTMFQQFINEPEIGSGKVYVYTGCLIPNFIDKNGKNLFIETMINNNTNETGIMCFINAGLFDDTMIDGNKYGIDLVGHNIEAALENGITDVNFLSYSDSISGTIDIPIEKFVRGLNDNAFILVYGENDPSKDQADITFDYKPTETDPNGYFKALNVVYNDATDSETPTINWEKTTVKSSGEIIVKIDVKCEDSDYTVSPAVEWKPFYNALENVYVDCFMTEDIDGNECTIEKAGSLSYVKWHHEDLL